MKKTHDWRPVSGLLHAYAKPAEEEREARRDYCLFSVARNEVCARKRAEHNYVAETLEDVGGGIDDHGFTPPKMRIARVATGYRVEVRVRRH